MRRVYGHLHYFTQSTALATLRDVGFNIIDYFHTDDAEVEPDPRGIVGRTYYELRRHLYRFKPHWAASLFAHFNLLVLARGSIEDRLGSRAAR
jgi:hypothetical protein